MRIQTYFGHVGVENGGYHIAQCWGCRTMVFMTNEERDSTTEDGAILCWLEKNVRCCPSPYYGFFPVLPFKNIEAKEFCPTCRQEIKGGE